MGACGFIVRSCLLCRSENSPLKKRLSGLMKLGSSVQETTLPFDPNCRSGVPTNLLRSVSPREGGPGSVRDRSTLSWRSEGRASPWHWSAAHRDTRVCRSVGLDLVEWWGAHVVDLLTPLLWWSSGHPVPQGPLQGSVLDCPGWPKVPGQISFWEMYVLHYLGLKIVTWDWQGRGGQVPGILLHRNGSSFFCWVLK